MKQFKVAIVYFLLELKLMAVRVFCLPPAIPNAFGSIGNTSRYTSFVGTRSDNYERPILNYSKPLFLYIRI